MERCSVHVQPTRCRRTIPYQAPAQFRYSTPYPTMAWIIARPPYPTMAWMALPGDRTDTSPRSALAAQQRSDPSVGALGRASIQAVALSSPSSMRAFLLYEGVVACRAVIPRVGLVFSALPCRCFASCRLRYSTHPYTSLTRTPALPSQVRAPFPGAFNSPNSRPAVIHRACQERQERCFVKRRAI
jgi:hypothetical protein